MELAQIDCAAILTLSQSAFGSNMPCSIASLKPGTNDVQALIILTGTIQFPLSYGEEESGHPILGNSFVASYSKSWPRRLRPLFRVVFRA